VQNPNAMPREIKCISCKQWSIIENENDFCVHCKKPLVEISVAEKASRERRRLTGSINIPISPNDSFLIRGIKQIFNLVQLIFISILSFILWLIFIGPG
jgi:hypothetical protein